MDRGMYEDTIIYKVVTNHEEQYSIWPVERENAPGWKEAGKIGTREDCLAYIKEVWTDMRPLMYLSMIYRGTSLKKVSLFA